MTSVPAVKGVDPDDVRVDYDRLYAFGLRAFAAAEQARLAVDVLIRSDARGIESHGFPLR